MEDIKIDLLKNSEIPSLLSLQEENLKWNISAETATAQGFLTFTYSPDFIKEMIYDMKQPVAKVGDEIVGYALASSLPVSEKNELLKPMVEISRSLEILKNKKYYLLAQVCVKDSLRGLGIFDDLYDFHKELFSKSFDCIVTEISVNNHRSLAAHERVGFKIIHQYKENGNPWHVVMWDWK